MRKRMATFHEDDSGNITHFEGSNGQLLPAAGNSLTVSATVLVPTLGSVTRQWLLDGIEIPGATGSSHVFNQASATPATRRPTA